MMTSGQDRWSRLAFLTSVTGLVVAPAIAGASGAPPQPRPALVAVPRRSGIRAIRIRHLSDALESPTAIDPADLSGRTDVGKRTIDAPSTVGAALRALEASRPTRARAFTDVRWELELLDAEHAPLFVVYADGFVLHGSVGAYSVTFANSEPLRTFLHAHDPLH